MTLKFREETKENDLKRFFIECERFDLLESTEIPEDGMIKSFIKKRRALVGKLKDFRKSQNSKLIWTRHRYSILKGIKKWTRSTKGKKFHRSLGRFLATRIVENQDEMIVNKLETLKALSSLHTHIFIELEYFRPSVDEDVELEFLVEYAIPFLNDIELKLLESKYDKIDEDEMEILFRLVDENEIINALSEQNNKPPEELAIAYSSLSVNEDLTYGVSYKFYKILNDETKMSKLRGLMEINEV